MKDRELVWVEKEFAEKYKEVESNKSKTEERIKIFNDYIDKVKEASKNEFKANLENLDEDVAIFNGLMLKVKQAFEKAKNEQFDASYTLWEKFDKELPSIQEKTGNIIATLNPLVEKFTKLNSMMEKIRTYDMERLIETINKMQELYGTSKEMFEFLVNNFTPKEGKQERRRGE